MQKIKRALQKTVLYRVFYLRFVKYFRILKRKIVSFLSMTKKKIKKFIKGKWNVIYRHYILKILYPSIYIKVFEIARRRKKGCFC